MGSRRGLVVRAAAKDGLTRSDRPRGPRFESRRAVFFRLDLFSDRSNSYRIDASIVSLLAKRSEVSSREQVRKDGDNRRRKKRRKTGRSCSYNCIVVVSLLIKKRICLANKIKEHLFEVPTFKKKKVRSVILQSKLVILQGTLAGHIKRLLFD